MSVPSVDHIVARRDGIIEASRLFSPSKSQTPSLRELTFAYRTKLDSDGRPVPLGPALLRPDHVGALLASVLEHEAVEVFGILCLTTRRRVICWHEVSRGGIEGVSIHPSDVFKAALAINAAAIILAHNHPSGDPEPSTVDVEATTRLAQIGTMLGLEVFDHVIIGQGAYISLRAAGKAAFSRRAGADQAADPSFAAGGRNRDADASEPLSWSNGPIRLRYESAEVTVSSASSEDARTTRYFA
jgi:proteasome lid subunit RPN8/RPN11